jgi:hypothetical protein
MPYAARVDVEKVRFNFHAASHLENCQHNNQSMRFILSGLFFLSFCTLLMGQQISQTKWYSETASNGIIIQNSFPRGGPFIDSTGKNTGHSFLIFFTCVINETATPLELSINFPADSFITGEDGTVYLKLFLPSDTMTLDKELLPGYGLTGLESVLHYNRPTMMQRTINPKEECRFYVVAGFFQTRGAVLTDKSRGGNRAELVLKGQDLFYRMPPQIVSLPIGHISLKK